MAHINIFLNNTTLKVCDPSVMKRVTSSKVVHSLLGPPAFLRTWALDLAAAMRILFGDHYECPDSFLSRPFPGQFWATCPRALLCINFSNISLVLYSLWFAGLLYPLIPSWQGLSFVQGCILSISHFPMANNNICGRNYE